MPQQAADLAEAVGRFARYSRRSRTPADVIDLVGLADRARTRLETPRFGPD